METKMFECELNELPFYEVYGTEWIHTSRQHHEELAATYKVNKLFSLFGNLQPTSILDFGCGLGVALDALSRRFRAEKAFGVDISSRMIRYAEARFPCCEFMVGDYRLLVNFNVDLITFIDVLEHLEDIEAVLRTAKNSSDQIAIKIPLEKTLYISTLNKLKLKKNRSRLFESEGHLYEFNKSMFNDVLTSAGLRILNSRTDFIPRNILFSDYMIGRMRSKSGVAGKLKGVLYLAVSKMPYKMTLPLFKTINGVDYYVLCKT